LRIVKKIYQAIKTILTNALLPTVLILIPFMVNWFYPKGFEASDILAYVGVCIFGGLVYYQTQKLHKQNICLQEQTLNLENNNLKYNTFVYLSVDKIIAEGEHQKAIKTYKLNKSIPIPSKVNPSQANSFRFEYETKNEEAGQHSTRIMTINPYEGVSYSSETNPEFVLWTTPNIFLQTTKYSPVEAYYTPIQLIFLAKSSRDFFVNRIEIGNFELDLICEENKHHWLGSQIEKPLIVVSGALPEINQNNCDHQFNIKLHLCHNYEDLLEKNTFNAITAKFIVTYVNLFGVRTKCTQEVTFGEKDLRTRIVSNIVIDSIDTN